MQKKERAVLKRFSFFSSFLDDELDRLAPFLENQRIPSETVLVQQGALADCLCYVKSGGLIETKDVALNLGIDGLKQQNKRCCVREVKPNNHCCEQMLVHNYPLTGDLIALKDTHLITLSKDSAAEIRQTDEALYHKLVLATAVSLAQRGEKLEKIEEIEASNKQLIKEMRIEKKKILALHRIARSTAESSVPKTLSTILDACMDCLSVEKGSVMIFDRGRLRVESAFGPDQQQIMGKEQEISEESISGRCFITQKPILIKDIAGHKGIKRAGGGEKYWNNSLLSIPLVSLHGESIGVLNVSKTSKELFDQQDLDILNDLAIEAGAALGHEIYIARVFKNFQETYAGIKKTREKMVGIEDRIVDFIGSSWKEERSEKGKFS